MNERIAELWDKAAESTMDQSWESQTKFMERFAELIVKECAELVKDGVIEQQAGDSNTYISVGAADIILEHFGVE